MRIAFKDRQKTKILKALRKNLTTYDQIQKETGINIDSLRGRMSLLRRSGYVIRADEYSFKITAEGLQFLMVNEGK